MESKSIPHIVGMDHILDDPLTEVKVYDIQTDDGREFPLRIAKPFPRWLTPTSLQCLIALCERSPEFVADAVAASKLRTILMVAGFRKSAYWQNECYTNPMFRENPEMIQSIATELTGEIDITYWIGGEPNSELLEMYRPLSDFDDTVTGSQLASEMDMHIRVFRSPEELAGSTRKHDQPEGTVQQSQ